MIFNFFIEPLEERYTAQWQRWIAAGMDALNLPHKDIFGKPLTSKIEVGSVLDVYGTLAYKQSQLRNFIEEIRVNGITADDIVFVHDLWFPGIEALAYIRNMIKVPFKIYGILHAGVYDNHDFTYLNGMRSWGRRFEKMLLTITDRVFVATEFHRDLILKMHKRIKSEIVVTGLFFENEIGEPTAKENIVVFPHRLDKEKNPRRFDRLAKKLKKTDWQFIKAAEVCKTKQEYYDLLNRAKIAVSFADQETFGYAMIEALAAGCHVVVPDRLSYSTMSIYDGMRAKDKNAADVVKGLMTAGVPKRVDLSEYHTQEVLKRMFHA
jgi:glycosyltransferase involved in cell wall biosynthesis